MGLLTLLESRTHRIAVAWKPLKRFVLAIARARAWMVER